MITVSMIQPKILTEMLRAAQKCPPGAFAEFGVYQGGSAIHLDAIARVQGRALWLFDTFNGIPYQDPIDPHRPGEFGHTSLAGIRAAIPHATVIPGIFPDSIAGLELPRFAFVHVDADQYRSVKAACEVFTPLMLPGGVIWFDDYTALPGATKAVDEYFGDRVQLEVEFRASIRF